MNAFLLDCHKLMVKKKKEKEGLFKTEVKTGFINMNTFRRLLHGRKYTRRKKKV